MKKIASLISVVLSLISTPSYSQNNIAACQKLSGYGYYPNISPVTKDKSGWIQDSITNGKSILTKKSSGELDILFVDSMNNKPVSSIEDGGQVLLLRKSNNQISVIVLYDKVTEIYTYWKTDDNQFQFSLLQSKGGVIKKNSAMVGACDFINFNW